MTGAVEGQLGDNQEEIEHGCFVLFANHIAAPGIPQASCPVRLGRVLRVVSENPEELYVVIEAY